MLTIMNIPNEVYEVALRYENIKSWGLDRAKEAYDHETAGKMYAYGLEQALARYLTKTGPFSESGEYAGVADEGYATPG